MKLKHRKRNVAKVTWYTELVFKPRQCLSFSLSFRKCSWYLYLIRNTLYISFYIIFSPPFLQVFSQCQRCFPELPIPQHSHPPLVFSCGTPTTFHITHLLVSWPCKNTHPVIIKYSPQAHFENWLGWCRTWHATRTQVLVYVLLSHFKDTRGNRVQQYIPQTDGRKLATLSETHAAHASGDTRMKDSA